MIAAGSNPRFAEAAGINVDRMRTIGTTISTVVAAVGIIVYSQSFGFMQLYGGPRQMGFIAASAILIGGVTATGGAVAGTSANWSFWQIGSRTVWTPVTNLDLSVELMYNAQQTAFTGPNIGNNSWWSGMFRAQRNFYP